MELFLTFVHNSSKNWRINYMHSAENNVLKGAVIIRSFNIQALDIIDHLNILNVITYNCMY